MSDILEEIDNLLLTHCERGISVKYQMTMIMIDGILSTIVSDISSSSTCNICLAEQYTKNPKDRMQISQTYSVYYT